MYRDVVTFHFLVMSDSFPIPPSTLLDGMNRCVGLRRMSAEALNTLPKVLGQCCGVPRWA